MDLNLPEAFEPLFYEKADDGRDVRFRAFYGGRGSAKSHSLATSILIKARKRRTNVLCAREVQHSIRDSIKRLLDNKIRENGWGVTGDGSFESTDNEIRGKNGSLVIFAGLRTNVDSIASMEGIDLAYVTEARSVSQASLDILLPTIRAPRSEIWFDWNPRDPRDPVDVMFRGPGGPPPRSIVRKVNFYDNPWFPDTLREDMEWDKRRDPDKYKFIWLGEYRQNSESRVFKNWRIGTHDEFDFDSRRAVFYFGADFGFSADPSTLIRVRLVGRTLYVDKELYRVGVEIDHMPFFYDQVMNENVTPGGRKWTIVGDSSRPETISYLRRKNFNIIPARKGAGSVEDGVEFLKSYDIVVHPECIRTIDELSLYSYEIDKKTGLVLPKLKDEHNHVIDALRYAVEPLRRSRVVPFARPIIISGERRAP
jgi:phage terminase large subunit